ncbi:MAG: DsbA family oxidoreductase [Chloroflexi bacterium]|nr:DsbA family oxidoreductase [Chloroflexota bacterium]
MQVEIWSDIVCPWCYIGKRRFEAALAAFDGRDDVSVRFRSFELAPDQVADIDQPLAEMLAGKLGVSLEQARAMNERVTTIAAEEGLIYQLDRARPASTFDAHRVTHLSAEAGIQGAVVERLHAGYFNQGARIGDREVLIQLAADAGLASESVRSTLDGGRFTEEVRADEALARQLGIRGVPFFVFDRRYGVSGAQGVHVLLATLERAAREVVLTN